LFKEFVTCYCTLVIIYPTDIVASVLLSVDTAAIVEVNTVETLLKIVVAFSDGISVEMSVVITSCVVLVRVAVVVATVVDGVVKIVVSISSGGFGTYGNERQLIEIGGPSIFSKTYPTKLPDKSPVMYEIVMILPLSSFKGAETFCGANNMGRLPATPFEIPKAIVKMNAGSSPPIVGFLRGATHRRRRGIRNARNVDIKISCLRDQA
jgi:hypothetical protein